MKPTHASQNASDIVRRRAANAVRVKTEDQIRSVYRRLMRINVNRARANCQTERSGRAVVIRFEEKFLTQEQADALFAALLREIAWKQQDITLFGKRVAQPRLTAWYGDPGATYVYSGLLNEPLPWTDALLAVRARIEANVGVTFNSALLNLYRDGRDSVCLHSDDEREVGSTPVIASLSLGATRTLVFVRRDKSGEKRTMPMTHGSLLVMDGDTQQLYKHGVPKEPSVVDPRINITFRRVRL
jgi:alkylated DNA repair dioxygenase AlkB